MMHGQKNIKLRSSTIPRLQLTSRTDVCHMKGQNRK